MSTTMDHLPDKIPTEGVIALLIATLTAKPLWRYLTRRKVLDATQERERAEHSAEIELRKITAEEGRDHKLVTTLERQVKEMRQEIGALRKEVGELRDERTQDKIVIATQAGTITAQASELKARDERIAKLERDNARLRTERDHYRQIGMAGGEALAASRPDASRQILDEISEADDATSQAGGKAP